MFYYCCEASIDSLALNTQMVLYSGFLKHGVKQGYLNCVYETNVNNFSHLQSMEHILIN